MRFWIIVSMMLGFALAAAPPPAGAQTSGPAGEVRALDQALHQLRDRYGIDIVFAQRLVDGRSSKCAYEGSQPEHALDCVLDGTGLRAERVRFRQYVLVNDDRASSGDEAPEIKGSLAGFVVDAVTGERLPGAHVQLPGLKLGTVTNEAGYFAIASLPAGAYDVQCSYVGYEVLLAELQTGTTARTIRLEPVVVEGETVVVHGSRNESADVATRPGLISASSFDLEQVPTIPGEYDLFQALRWTPGVRKAAEISGGMVIRGGEPDQNLYLLDGAPVYHPWHAFSLISTFQSDSFKDVKLYRGAFPAQHGGRLAAVLDAEMKDGEGVAPGAAAGISTLSGRFRVETPVTRTSSVMISGRRSYLDKLIGSTHPVTGAGGRRDTLRTGYYFYDVSGKYSLRMGRRHQFSFSIYRGGDDLDLRLPFDVSLDFSSWLRPADLFFQVQQAWENRVYSARYRYLHAPRLFLTATAYSSAYDAREAALWQPTTETTLASDYEVRLSDLGFRLDLDYYLAASHQLEMGVQIVNRSFRGGLKGAVDHSLTAVDSLVQTSRLHAPEFVAYAEDTWQPLPRWTLQPGLRFSMFGEGGYTHLAPMLNVRYELLPHDLVLRAGAGMQVQYLHRLRDRYSFMYDVVSSRWIPSGKAVEPATSRHATVGAVAEPEEWLRLTADAYWRSSRNVLLPEDVYRSKDGFVGPGIEVGTLLGQYTPGYGRAYGLELTARAHIGSWLIWAGYAGGRSLNRAPELGEARYRPARFDIPRSLRAFVRHSWSKWYATLSAELRSGYPHSVPVARYALGAPLRDTSDEGPSHYLYRPDVNNGRLPPFARLDLAFGYQFEWVGAAWKAEMLLHNVSNRRNVYHRQYIPEADGVRMVDRRGLPLIPLASLEMKL